MSSNRFRDYYLSIETERDPARKQSSQSEIDAAVMLARACIFGGIALAAVLGGLVYAWVR